MHTLFFQICIQYSVNNFFLIMFIILEFSVVDETV